VLHPQDAVASLGADAPFPAHYGAILREQRRLERGRSVVDLGGMEILQVSGADARTWLTTITSQVVTGVPVGTSLALAVLSPQGEQEVLLLVDPGRRAPLRQYLASMVFMSRVELTDRDDLRILGGVAPAPEVIGERLALPAPVAVWQDPWPAVTTGGVSYGPDPEDPTPWVLSILPAAGLEALTWPLELLAGIHAAEALRIANHRPRLVLEADERTIPHELDLLRTAVHTAKGCYRGQETVAKVLNLGQPPRRLVMLHLDGSQDVAASSGAEVRLGDREKSKVVGRVTSTAMHADLGPIALAVVKRAVPLDAPLLVRAVIGGDASADMGGDAGGADTSAPSTNEQEFWLDATQEPIVVARDHGQRPETARL
jgi:folate-binding protein YgfZ